MIPSGFALATAGTIWRKIAAFLRIRSRRVSPGFWAAPAAMTVMAAPRHSSSGPDQTRAVFANGTAWRRSIASPSARRAFASTSRISDASPERSRPNAKVDPTAPAPTIATRVGWGTPAGDATGTADCATAPTVASGAAPGTGLAARSEESGMARIVPRFAGLCRQRRPCASRGPLQPWPAPIATTTQRIRSPTSRSARWARRAVASTIATSGRRRHGARQAAMLDGGDDMTSAPAPEMKRTLSLTGLTINAMALIAPGAFRLTTFQSQTLQTNGASTTAMDMVPGLLFALVLAFLTAWSYGELSNLYPSAGAGSSYYFAEAAFLEREEAIHYKFARLAKFVVGWISHLYYWIYPGIMVAFTGVLVVYIAGLFGITLSTPIEVALVVIFAALTGLIAFRGISGSTMTAVVINVIQLTALLAFAILAVVFRLTHPDLAYAHKDVVSVVLPHDLTNVLFQGTIAILLLVGFESVTALGAEAKNPKRDVRRAVLLSLAIQGIFAYLIEYVAANFAVSSALTATVTGASGAATTVSGCAATETSGAPIGDLVKLIGDTMLGGTGTVLALILAGTVLIALIGTTLACLNTGVRITYVMG